MDSLFGKAIGIGGILVALVSISANNESKERTSKEIAAYQHGVQQNTSAANHLADLLDSFQSTLDDAVKHAAEAPGNYDYIGYTQTKQARNDLQELSIYLEGKGGDQTNALLNKLSIQLDTVTSLYRIELKNTSTVGREIKRSEGLLLSYRRQIGIITTAIKQASPARSLYALAEKAEVMLDETL